MSKKKPAKLVSRDHNTSVKSGFPVQQRICLAIPTTGLVRYEWVLHRYGQVIPVNWSAGEVLQWFDSFSPVSFAVDHARNMCVQYAVEKNFEWLFFIDHDVIIPVDTFLKMNEYVSTGEYPVVSGLYAAKGFPPEPLVFRGYGNSWFRDWKKGDKVMCDGVPMGCTLISMKLLKPMWEASKEYSIHGQRTRQVFHTPREFIKREDMTLPQPNIGTEDLWWCDRVMKQGWLAKTGYKKLSEERYPFLVDSSIWCGHINEAGRVYWPPDDWTRPN